MKIKIEQNTFSFLIFLTTLAVFLFFPKQSLAKVIINEIAWMGTDESQYGEWVELYNDGNAEVDLKNWKLYKRKSGVDLPIITLTKKIGTESYYLIERTTDTSTDPILGIEDDAGKWSESGLSNSGEFLSLKDTSDNTVDSVDGTNGWKINGSTIIGNNTKPKRTAQRIGTAWKTLSPTPKAKNEDTTSSEKDEKKETKPSSQSIRINEVLPNPSAKKDDGEYIEFYNTGDQDIDLSGWQIRLSAWPTDPTKKPTEFSIKTNLDGKTSPIINSRGFFTLLRNRNSTLTLSNTEKFIELIDPSNAAIDSMHYEKAETDIAFNYTPNGWRKSKILTPGAINIFNNAPETKKVDVPDSTLLNVLTSFSASGQDGDGEKIKYTWDFGDGHKSYKQKTTHRYTSTGKFDGTLTISDGTEETMTQFIVDVEKYEAPKVRMTAVVPNPTGRDTDAEYITLENRSKKQVDLIGWSIATGWKKLVNHPIRESFVLKKKSTRQLTREFSAFTLPNGKGKIELRSPDGKTVQKMKYNLKGKSAEENARLVKEKGKKWEWITNQGADGNEGRTVQTADAPPAGGTTAVINQQEKQLKKDTEIITQKKLREEKLVSAEKNSEEEMRRLIAFGTHIETPITILDITPRIAGAQDTASPSIDTTDDNAFNLNALINNWLARE